jgi:hypothetical protein
MFNVEDCYQKALAELWTSFSVKHCGCGDKDEAIRNGGCELWLSKVKTLREAFEYGQDTTTKQD